MNVEWIPTPEFIRTTNLYWLMQRVGVATYAAAHAWSVAHREEFWQLVRERLQTRPGNCVAQCFAAPPESPAILQQTAGGQLQRFSVRDLDELSNRVANGLQARGLQPGEPVGIVMPLTAQAAAIYLGILKAGGVVVGACIFNCLGVVGISALLRPLLAPNINQTDLGVMLIATVAVLPLLHAGPRKRQIIGVALLVGYGLYLTQLLGRHLREGL